MDGQLKAKETEEKSNSYTPPDRSTYDPGWNDPPQMTTPAAAVPAKRLNKRVAFPMQSSGSTNKSNTQTTAEGLPLPFSTAKYNPPQTSTALIYEPNATQTLPCPAIAPPPSIPVTFSNSPPAVINDAFDSIKAQEFCHSVFIRSADAMAVNTDDAKLTEIRRRLELLGKMWQECKISESAQKNLYQLAQALEVIDIETALEQQRLLATQHVNISTQWATALRQIILSISPHVDEPAQLLPESENQTLPVSVSTIDHETSENNSTGTQKSRFGRIGRILHI